MRGARRPPKSRRWGHGVTPRWVSHPRCPTGLGEEVTPPHGWDFPTPPHPREGLMVGGAVKTSLPHGKQCGVGQTPAMGTVARSQAEQEPHGVTQDTCPEDDPGFNPHLHHQAQQGEAQSHPTGSGLLAGGGRQGCSPAACKSSEDKHAQVMSWWWHLGTPQGWPLSVTDLERPNQVQPCAEKGPQVGPSQVHLENL